MIATPIRLAKNAYEPMIKFVGARHPLVKHAAEIVVHPCATNGMLPGSKECIPVGKFMENYKPFRVVPIKHSARTSLNSSKASAFIDRPLEKDELASIFELPARFRYKPINENELESINSGGAW
ncbi:AHL_G0017650.mRNA.1.CDS.1 [Saccharomyces cerevisiae]|uniref:Alpha-ketoglutarate dehydrogenase subunit KGD4 n=1 Tax=Saccharomyces paradoxus TaxID=27291 RepID=A0A8B8UQT9_SACPA|nr:Ymr31 [Saccharomyces paradoxus]AJP38548.1 Ymr31p [Saccharomyces cerevisiae YJM1078]AJU35774.1 Ymr31p [Saccharomyces cerevisiae YJM248]AJU39884.1 Ymr31p [Saccharomyces cerevisiae YJM1252]CAI4439006.1 CPG_1a_G0017680.mRNA.1.CDS.1 [Saccharomyces cerevisiae]QHS73082.1 Ymr31 [Saccharomyces paradoxus]